MDKITPISDVVWFQEGPGVRNTQYTTEGVKLLNVANLVDGEVDLSNTNRYISEEEAYGKYKHFLVDEGDLIIASSGIKVVYFDKKMGFIKAEHLPLCMNTSTIRFKTLNADVLDIQYFMYFLKSESFKQQLAVQITGSAQLNFGPSHLKKMSVKVVPIAQQKEIVHKFSEIDRLISYRQQQLIKLDELVKSRFIEMFGDISTGVYNYETRKLGDVAFVGSSHRVFTTEFVDEGIPFYRGTEIGELANGIKPSDPYYISEEHYNRLASDESKPQIGDLLMPSICNKGQVWMVDTDEPFYYKDGRVLCISADRSIYNTKYLQYFMREKTQIEYPKLGSGSTFAEFKIFLLKDIDVLTPPMEVQNQFATFVEQTDKLKFEVKEALEKLEILKKALMQEYFG